MSEAPTQPMSERRRRKLAYRTRLESLLSEYRNILVCGLNNVGSKQMQNVRAALRGKAVIMCGKNTVIRKVVREFAATHPKLEALIPHIWGNVGFVFTNENNLIAIRNEILSHKVPAAAKTGGIAQCDVFVEPGPTGLDPGQTSFFQSLNIATKIARGAIEIVSQVHLINKGEKVTASHVVLLEKIGLRPFSYNISVDGVYEDGSFYDAEVLDLTPEDLMKKFYRSVGVINALSLEIGFPTFCSIPNSIQRAFRNLLALSFSTAYEFEAAKLFKNAAATATAAPAASSKKEAKEEKKVEEEEEDESSDGAIGGGLFGGDSDEEDDEEEDDEDEEEEDEDDEE